jgi:GNAT superfamily N-acetyltransferase
MKETPTIQDDVIIQPLEEKHLSDFSDLYISGIPNAVFCALGRGFLSIFFAKLTARSDVCAFVAVDGEGRVHGIIAGTLCRSVSYGAVLRENRWALLQAAGLRLLSPRVIRWIIGRLVGRLRPVREDGPDMPDAELLVISVCSEARGTGLARRMIAVMDDWFADHGFKGEYTILTEASNTLGNAFHKSVGAKLVTEGSGHRAINSYVRKVNPSRVSEECSE